MKAHKPLIVLLFLCPSLAVTQDLKLSLGAGIPDLLHAGISTSISDKNEIGFQIGTIPIENLLLTPTLEHRLYFKKSKEHKTLNTWFFGQRVSFYYERSDEYRWTMVFLNVSVGRNMYLGEKMGISLDTGIVATLHDQQHRISDGSEVEDDSPTTGAGIFPNIRVQFFYRL